MIEDSIRHLMPSSVITSKMPQIIEAFVEYYGENRRQEITDRLNSIIIIKFSDITTLENNIQNVFTSLFKEIFNVDQNTYLFLNPDDIIDFVNETRPYIYIEDKVKKAISGKEKISDEEFLKNYKNGFYPKLDIFIEKYKELKTKITPYIEQLEREQENEEKLSKKYYEILLEEFKDLLTEEDMKTYRQLGFASPNMINLFGTHINNDGNCFDDESEKALTDPEASQWKKDSILEDRARIIHSLFDPDRKYINPPQYEDYLNNPECAQIIERMRIKGEQISKRQKELFVLLNKELLESLEDYQINKAIIDKLNLLNKDIALGPFIYDSLSISCFEGNYIMGPNGPIFCPFVFINASTSEMNVIHEINHALEYHTISVDEKGSKSICGWEIVSVEFSARTNENQEIYKGITRPYELLSEYINDRLAEEITKTMHKKGSFIYNINDERSQSDYRTIAILAEEFFKTFKDIIIESRHNGNINYLFEQLGRENYEELNNIIREFYEKFGLFFTAITTINAYNNNEENERLPELVELIRRKDEVLAKMKEHLQSKSIEKIG